MGSVMTKAQRAILRSVDNRAEDIYDLSDSVRRKVERVFDDCAALKASGLVDWMYPEDAVSITPAGRAALEAKP